MREYRFLFISLVLIGALALLTAAFISGAPTPEQEPNDSVSTATSITISKFGTYQEWEGTVNSRTDRYDYYKFAMRSSQYVELDFVSTGRDTSVLELIESGKMTTIRTLTSSRGGWNHTSYYHACETSQTSYFIRISTAVSLVDSPYQFNITVQAQDDGDLNKDASADVRSPDEVDSRAHFHGCMADLDTRDVYAFRAGEGDAINIYFASHSTDGQTIRFHGPTGNLIWSEVSRRGSVESTRYLTSNETPISLWTIVIMSDGNPGPYEVSINPIKQREGLDLDEDAGGTMEGAITFHYATHFGRRSHGMTGELGHLDTVDWSWFEAGGGEILVIYFQSAGGSLQHCNLTDETGTVLMSLMSPGDNKGYEKRFYTAFETPVGRWYINVSTQDPSVITQYLLYIEIRLQDDCGFDQDAPEEPANAVEFPSKYISGTIADLDTKDLYMFWTEGGETLEINFEANIGTVGRYLYLSLMDYNENELSKAEAFKNDPGFIEYDLPPSSTGPEPYYLLVWYDGSPMIPYTHGHYTCDVDFHEYYDAWFEQDAPNDRSRALETGTGVHTGYLWGTDNKDCFKVNIGGGDLLYIHMPCAYDTEDMTLRFFGPLGSQLIYMLSYDEKVFLTATESPQEWFYIEITGDDIQDPKKYQFWLIIEHQWDSAAEDDAPGTFSSGIFDGVGTEIEPGDTATGRVGGFDPIDMYKFEAGGGARIEVGYEVFTDERISLVLSSADNATTRYLSLSKRDVAGALALTTAFETSLQDWYITIINGERLNQATDVGDYYYRFTVNVVNQSETLLPGGDAPATFEDAVESMSGSGSLSDLDDVDVYAFTAGEGMIILPILGFDFGPVYVNVEVYGPDGSLLTSLPFLRYVTANETPMETYYLKFTGVGEYTFSILPNPQNDAMHQVDAPASLDTTVMPAVATSQRCVLGDLDRVDYYRVHALPGLILSITARVSSSYGPYDLTVIVYDEDFDEVSTFATSGPGLWTKNISIPADLGPNEYWYFRVGFKDDNEESYRFYHIEVDFLIGGNPDTPDIDHTPPPDPPQSGEDLDIEVIVTDVDEVVSVTLFYMLEGDSEWKSIAMTADGDVWSATIPSEDLEEGKKLMYYVMAEDVSGNTQYTGSISDPIELGLETPPEKTVGDEGALTTTAIVLLAVGLIIGVLVGYIFAGRTTREE